MRFKVIVNPLAGRGYGGKAAPQIKSLLEERKLDFDLVCTRWAGEAIDLARQAVLEGYETVVAVGGDGTYQEVINGMLAASREKREASTPAAAANGTTVGNLGLIPVGSGCDFAFTSGIPSDLETACARLAEQRTRLVDLAKVTFYAQEGAPGISRYFDNAMGIGFDGIVTLETRKFKHVRGLALYLPVVLKTVFMTLKPMRSSVEYHANGATAGEPGIHITGDTGQTHVSRLDKTTLMVTVCNGQREGGGFFIAPNARNDDGLLDVCVAEYLPRLQILGLIPHFMKGTHVNHPKVTMFQSRRIVITSPDPLIAHADGEMLCTDAHRIECEIVPEQVRVVY